MAVVQVPGEGQEKTPAVVQTGALANHSLASPTGLLVCTQASRATDLFVGPSLHYSQPAYVFCLCSC